MKDTLALAQLGIRRGSPKAPAAVASPLVERAQTPTNGIAARRTERAQVVVPALRQRYVWALPLHVDRCRRLTGLKRLREQRHERVLAAHRGHSQLVPFAEGAVRQRGRRCLGDVLLATSDRQPPHVVGA